jgi:STE20-like kinase
MNEMKRLQKQENRQLQLIENTLKFQLESQQKKYEQEVLLLIHERDTNLQELDNDHRTIIESLALTHFTEIKEFELQNKVKQEQEYKAFREKLHSELKSLKHDVEKLPKEHRKARLKILKEQKEIEHVEKDRKFREHQEEVANLMKEELLGKHRMQIEPKEMSYLQDKHRLKADCEQGIAQLEEQNLTQKHEITQRLMNSKSTMAIEMLKRRHKKETDQIKSYFNIQIDTMKQQHQMAEKRLPRDLKAESRVRTQQFRASVRLTMSGDGAVLQEQMKQFEEREKQRLDEGLSKFKAKHKLQLDALLSSRAESLKEHELAYNEKLKDLTDNNSEKRRKWQAEYEAELKKLKQEVYNRMQVLDKDYKQQLASLTGFYGRTPSDTEPGTQDTTTVLNR